MSYQHILVDDPRPRVRRITLNRPEKRNALNNRLRGEIFEVLEAADRDADVSITILRGAGPCFSAGYDLSADNTDRPALSFGVGTGPVVAPCGRGLVLDLGSRQAGDRAGARLLPCRRHRARHRLRRGLCRRRRPDRLSAGAADEPAGHAVSSVAGRHAPRHGIDADRRRHVAAARPREWGFATRAFPLAELEQRTLDFAERAAKVPVELQQLNKRSVHRAMEIMGARAAMRAGTEIQALAFTTEASRAYMSSFRRDGGSVKAQLDQRDTSFGDYRTKKP